MSAWIQQTALWLRERDRGTVVEIDVDDVAGAIAAASTIPLAVESVDSLAWLDERLDRTPGPAEIADGDRAGAAALLRGARILADDPRAVQGDDARRRIDAAAAVLDERFWLATAQQLRVLEVAAERLERTEDPDILVTVRAIDRARPGTVPAPLAARASSPWRQRWARVRGLAVRCAARPGVLALPALVWGASLVALIAGFTSARGRRARRTAGGVLLALALVAVAFSARIDGTDLLPVVLAAASAARAIPWMRGGAERRTPWAG